MQMGPHPRGLSSNQQTTMKTTHIYSYLSIIIFFYPGLISTTNEAAEHRTAHTPTTHSLFPIPTNPPSPPIPNPDSYPFKALNLKHK
jgi:hypothetical protein